MLRDLRFHLLGISDVVISTPCDSHARYMVQIRLYGYLVCLSMFDLPPLADDPSTYRGLSLLSHLAHCLAADDSDLFLVALLVRSAILIFDHLEVVADVAQRDSNSFVKMTPVGCQFHPHLLPPTHTRRLSLLSPIFSIGWLTWYSFPLFGSCLGALRLFLTFLPSVMHICLMRHWRVVISPVLSFS